MARRPIRSGYEHLAPLFAERATLPEGDPRRERLRDELIAGHLPVARHIARRYVHRGDNPEDLEQVASVGLVLAVDRFDPARGVDFFSFAVPTISGEVLRYFRDRASPIRTPRRLRALQSMIYDAAAELGQRHRRAPGPARSPDTSAWTSRPCWRRCRPRARRTPRRWTSRPADGDGPGDRPRFEAALAQVEEEFDLVEYREALAPLLAELPDRERRILLLRFFGGLTQTEIGAQVGISQMHVSRQLSRTLSQLRVQLLAD